MSYQINFTDTTKSAIVVEDSSVNDSSTSLVFPGRNFSGYGQVIAEDFLHLLENFANIDPPGNPQVGQLWYDSNEPVQQLKIYNGTEWLSASGLQRSNNQPSNARSGDLWVNTDTQQLYLYSGSGWVLVGPEFSQGYQSGPKVETIADTFNTPRTIISNYVDDVRVAIISANEFVPKERISGFSTIYEGITLNTGDTEAGISNNFKYRGTAEKADALVVNGALVAASKFLRNDTVNNTQFPINIRSSGGISVGEDAQLSLFVDGTTGVLFNKTSGASLDIKMSNQGVPTTVIRVNSDKKVGINKSNPIAALDVVGDFRLSPASDLPDTSGILTVTGTINSTTPTTGSLVVSGGVGIAKNLTVGLNATVNNTLTVLDAIMPNPSSTVSSVTNIGTAAKPFNNVHAANFFGDFEGTLTGSVIGNIQGTATQLASPTIFELYGDITSNEIAFDGANRIPTATILSAAGAVNTQGVGTVITLTFAPQLVAPFPTGSQIRVEGIQPVGYAGTWVVTNGTTSSVQYRTDNIVTGDMVRQGKIYAVTDSNKQRFFTQLSSSFVADKAAITTIQENDVFLVSRLEGGDTTLRKITKTSLWKSMYRTPIGALMPYAGTIVPKGWLWCDGSEVQISNFPDLFRAIGYSYGATSTLQGLDTFRLPDLRTRFPLGRSTMDNEILVPSKVDPNTLLQSNSLTTKPVTDAATENLGYKSGDEDLTVSTGTTSAINANVDVVSTNQMLNVMNPYQTFNYIIYTGQDV